MKLTSTTSLEIAAELYSSGRFSEALQVARKLIEQRRENIAILNLAAACSRALGAPKDAENYWARAIQMAPNNAEIHNNLGVLLQDLERYEEAEEHLRNAVRLQPDYAAGYFNLARLFSSLNRLEESEDLYKRALSIRPDYLGARYNLGVLFNTQGRLAEARKCYEQALSIDPNYIEARFGLGNFFVEEKEFSNAETCYRRILSMDANHAGATLNLGLLLLTLGRMSEGWPLHEARLPEQRHALPDLPYPLWSGESLRGKSILIWPERGFGDEIQFVRFLPQIKALGAAKITLVCKDPLEPLFSNSPVGADLVLSENEALRIGKHHDYWVLPMSLPFHLKTTLVTIPKNLPYLKADDKKINFWKNRLPTKGIKVGLVWKGSADHKNDCNRSLPGLETLKPLWSVPGISFISLQKWAGENEGSTPPPEQPILHVGSDIRDFSDTAAIVSELDLVICVDTSIAHLAGALGKQCWVLLPYIRTDWRWMESREDSLWYPGVMRLFRQSKRNDWTTTIAKVAAELANFSPVLPSTPIPFAANIRRQITKIWKVS